MATRYATLTGPDTHGIYIVSPEVIETDTPPGVPWVAIGNAGPGWVYDGTAFMPPSSVEVPWTKKEFLLKFTPAEYAVVSAATKLNAVLDYYWQLFMVAESVLKTDPVTIAGVQALEVNGLLAVGRAAEILA